MVKATRRERRTLGPVSDLERHLPEDWWRTLFNSNYLRTDGDVVENAQNTRLEVDMLVAAASLQPTHSVLDLCCGQGRHAIELARRGHDQVTGLDRSRYLIRLARRRAKEAGLSVVFKEGDARRLRIWPTAFDCVCLMGNSFGYFEHVSDDKSILVAARRALRPGGTIVLDVVDGDWTRNNLDLRSWEWIDRNLFVCRERTLSSNGDRVISREVVTHAERGVVVDQFYAERLYSKDRLTGLLTAAGFEHVTLVGDIQALSDRNQDLGMMAQRLLFTARAPARASAATPSAPRCVLAPVEVDP